MEETEDWKGSGDHGPSFGSATPLGTGCCPSPGFDLLVYIIAKLGCTGWWVPRSPFYEGGASQRAGLRSGHSSYLFPPLRLFRWEGHSSPSHSTAHPLGAQRLSQRTAQERMPCGEQSPFSAVSSPACRSSEPSALQPARPLPASAQGRRCWSRKIAGRFSAPAWPWRQHGREAAFACNMWS